MSVATATKPKKKRKIITRKMREQQKPSDNLIDLNEYRKGVKKKPKNVEPQPAPKEELPSSKYKTSTNELVDKILLFCMALTGVSLFPYQVSFAKRIIKAVITNDSAEITALFSRQSGKSETTSVVVSGLMVILPVLANTPAFYHDDRFIKFREGFWCGIQDVA